MRPHGRFHGEPASNLGKIRSGTLDLKLDVSPSRNTGSGGFGFELHGPFALGKRGGLPVARVAYTQIADGKRATVTIISTGSKAYVAVGGKTYELSEKQASSLRVAGSAGRGLEKLGIGDWIENPKRSGCGSDDCVRAKLNVVNAANGLGDLVRGLGRHFPRIRGASAKQLEKAVRSSSFELETGKKDRLLRRLTIDADLGFDVPKDLRAALGDLVGARVRFELGVANPNRPVHVSAPANALPPSALPSGG